MISSALLAAGSGADIKVKCLSGAPVLLMEVAAARCCPSHLRCQEAETLRGSYQQHWILHSLPWSWLRTRKTLEACISFDMTLANVVSHFMLISLAALFFNFYKKNKNGMVALYSSPPPPLSQAASVCGPILGS